MLPNKYRHATCRLIYNFDGSKNKKHERKKESAIILGGTQTHLAQEMNLALR